ncbi:ribosomal protein L21-like protein [Lipomyces japonicus]|uniref:mitochondrial 54S ribosomal protein bL21m n=1 Tax=Lipomyces japonicus TaxID=56871 RepID=UPI0034CDF570
MAFPSIRCGLAYCARPLLSIERSLIPPATSYLTRTASSTSSQLNNVITPNPSVSLPSSLSQKLTLNSTIAKPTDHDLAEAFNKNSGWLGQNNLYAVFRIHTNQYLVSIGDKITLPYRLRDANIGDVIRLTQIETLGTRKFTWKGEPFINDDRVVVRARVVEETKEPLRVKIRKQQRTRRTKHITSKHTYTVLTISEIGVNLEPENNR